jgi:phosphohistidine phosphatase
MILYLVRHGVAKSAADDPEKGLSQSGTDDVRKVAEFLAGAGVVVPRIVHSNKKRAVETARLLAEFLKPSGKPIEVGGLNPTDDPKLWFDRIAGGVDNKMLVGHLPHLGKLASLLITDESQWELVDFKPASVVCLERDTSGKWFIEWMVTPDSIP